MKNCKGLLVAMVVCGTALFGCASQEIEKVEEPKVEQVKPVEEQPVKQEETEPIEQEPVKQEPTEQPVEQPVEQEATEPVTEVEEEPVIEAEESVAEAEENGIWGDSKPQYEDLQTTKIELIETSDDKILMLYNGTILDYVNDVTKETNGESVDYELTSQLLMVAFCSIDEAETEFTLVDNEGTVIYKYLNGEPLENGLENLQ